MNACERQQNWYVLTALNIIVSEYVGYLWNWHDLHALKYYVTHIILYKKHIQKLLNIASKGVAVQLSALTWWYNKNLINIKRIIRRNSIRMINVCSRQNVTEFHKTNMINLLGMTRRFSSIFQKTETRHVVLPIYCVNRVDAMLFSLRSTIFIYAVTHVLINVYGYGNATVCYI